MLQRWQKYFRERRFRKAYLRQARERLVFLGLWNNVPQRQDWETLDFLAGIGGKHLEALCQARRHQEMLAEGRAHRGDPRLN